MRGFYCGIFFVGVLRTAVRCYVVASELGSKRIFKNFKHQGVI